MRPKIIAAILFGLILGAVATLIAVHIAPQNNQVRPTVPRNAIPHEFNGDKYYIIPLSNYACK
jgi:hypothetical protein